MCPARSSFDRPSPLHAAFLRFFCFNIKSNASKRRYPSDPFGCGALPLYAADRDFLAGLIGIGVDRHFVPVFNDDWIRLTSQKRSPNRDSFDAEYMVTFGLDEPL